MDFPAYISIQTGPAPLTPGAVVLALVEEALAPDLYRLLIQGFLLQVEIPLSLERGQTLPLRVREVTPERLVFDLPVAEPAADSPEPVDEPSLLRRLHLPPSPEAERLVREFIRFNAPIDRARIESALPAVRQTREPARFEAAAYLVSRGLDPWPELVSRLARVAEPPAPLPVPEPEVRDHPLLREYLAPLMRIAESSPPSIPPPLPMHQDLVRTLDASPRLRLLDEVIRIVAAAEPAPPTERPEAVVREIVRLVEEGLLGRPQPDKIVPEVLARLRLPAESLRELVARLEEIERRTLAEEPLLQEARRAQGRTFDLVDRATVHRFLTQLSYLRDEGVVLYEIPIRQEEHVHWIPVRVIRREARPGSKQAREFHVTLDTNLSHLGAVRTRLRVSGPALSVRFEVQDSDARRALEEEAGGLVDALRDLGWKASVSAEIGRRRDESPFDLFASGANYFGVDVRA